jgi:hypothetical protein
MAGKPWTEQERAEAWSLRDSGMTASEVARKLGRTLGGVESQISSMNSNPPKATPAPSMQAETDNMELSALRQEVRKLKEGKPHVTSEHDDEEEAESDPKEVWDRAERDCDRKISKVKKAGLFSAEFDAKPIGITFVSDQHIAPGTPVAMKRMREDAELIASTPRLFACLNGDGIDGHIKHRAAILGARSTPDDQWRLFDYYLQIFHESILLITSGNHDAWTVHLAGTDVLRRIAEQNKVRYAPHEARLTVKVGTQPYSLALRHQFRMNSSFNQTHAVKQWFRLGESDFDIGVVSHHHECAVEQFLARGQMRYAIRPGSYQITSSYAADLGYSHSIPACPTVILFPGERKVWVFHDVRDGAECLNLLLGK